VYGGHDLLDSPNSLRYPSIWGWGDSELKLSSPDKALS